MKKFATLVIATLALSLSAAATKYTLTNGNFGSQTASISFSNGDVIEVPAGKNVSFTSTQTISQDITLDIYGTLKMTPGNKILTLGSGTLVNIYNGGTLSGSDADQRLVIGTNNVFNGAGEVNSTGATLTATSTSMGFASATPLPISFMSFDVTTNASGTKLSLVWTAVNDKDEASMFTIEQSIDGRNWISVANIAATAAAHRAASYSYELEVPKATKTAIYRIRYEGADAQAEYSAARSVAVNNKSAEATAVVSTAGNSIRVSINGLADAHATVYVTTLDGRIIYNQDYTSATGETLSILTNSPGMYVVTATDNLSFRTSQKVVLQ
jgi:hypothetical protein